MKKLLAAFLLFSSAASGQQYEQHYFFDIVDYNAPSANLTDSTIAILKKRLSHSGIKDCSVAYIAEKKQFEIGCSKFSDTVFIATKLAKPYKVIFFETYNFEELASLLQANTKTPVKAKQQRAEFYRLIHAADNSNEKIGSALLGFTDINDTAAFEKIKNALKDKLPADIFFAYQSQTELYNAHLLLYALHNNQSALPVSRLLDSATVNIDHRGYPVISLSFNKTGASLFHRMTLKNVQRQIAIVIDDAVCSVPKVTGPIEGGHAEIAGGFTMMATKEIVDMLNAGQLPLQLKLANNVSQ